MQLQCGRSAWPYICINIISFIDILALIGCIYIMRIRFLLSSALISGFLWAACSPSDTAQFGTDTPPLSPAKTVATSTPLQPLVKTASLQARFVPRHPFQARRCMNMGNALEADNEGDWGYRIEARHFQYIKQAGFDTVRIPIKWDAHSQSHPPYLISRSFMERVKQVVRQAQANGLGVIINMHHYDDFIENPHAELPRYLAMWHQISTVFRQAPSTIYFELLNEPTRAISNAQLNQVYAQVLPLIRRTNPNRALIIGGNNWNSVESLSEIRWPRDPNLVATFHDYGPHEFTHQGASWVDPPVAVGRRWGHAEDYADLRDTYAIAANFQSHVRLPILIGEFGVIDSVQGSQRAEWLYHRRRAIEQAGYSWCVWDFAGAFSTFDTARRQWHPDMLKALTNR